MNAKIPVITFFVLLLIVSYACTKGKSTTLESPPDLKVATGKIVFTGLLAADGCEYVFRTTKNEELKPVNLSPEFSKDGLEVSISYTKSAQKYSCGMAATQLKTIDIVKITRKK